MEKQSPPSLARFPSKRKVPAPESFERAPRGRFLSNIKVPIQIAQLSGRDGERTQPKAAALHLIIKCPGNLGRRVVQWPTPAPLPAPRQGSPAPPAGDEGEAGDDHVPPLDGRKGVGLNQARGGGVEVKKSLFHLDFFN